jgi:hypothetical protein
MTIERIDTGARMSKVVIHGDTVYLAGFTADKAARWRRRRADGGDPIDHRRLFGEGRHRQDQASARHHLALRHPHPWTQGVGRLGTGRLRARPRLLLQGPEKKVEIQVMAAR